MFCSNCGKEIDSNSNFCSQCGFKIDKDNKSQSLANTKNKKNHIIKNNKIKKFLIIVIGTILVVWANISDKEIPIRQKYILECEKSIKTKLKHPSTYVKQFASDKVEDYNGKTGVIIYFSAKNSFNLTIKYQGTCLLNQNLVVESSTIKEI